MAGIKAGKKPKGARRKPAARASRERLVPAVSALSRWFNRLLIFAGLAFVAVVAAQAWMYLVQIPVEQITVTGKLKHTRSEEVQARVQPALEGGFLQADLALLQEQLEALPWIYSAQVRRRWPSSLEIHVVEQLPIARWGEGGFLNHEGEVFQSERSEQWQDLPRLLGPEGSNEAMVDSYQRLLEHLAPLGLRVELLESDERGQLRAELAGGTELLVGDSEFKERLKRFTTLYRGTLGERAGDLARVDLRYQQGVAVVFREPPQVAGVET